MMRSWATWWPGGREGFDMTIIEVMPMGDIGNENRLDQYLPVSLVRSQLAKRFTLTDLDYSSGGPHAMSRLVRPAASWVSSRR